MPRRDLVWTSEVLLWWPRTWRGAIENLYKLAQHETESAMQALPQNGLLFSFTPGFSHVAGGRYAFGNRLNGFRLISP